MDLKNNIKEENIKEENIKEENITDLLCKICYNNNENIYTSCCLNKICNDCYSKIINNIV